MQSNKSSARLFSAFLIGLCLLFLNSTNVFAIGQMSEPINIENAMKGEEYSDQLVLVNTDNEAVKLGFTAEGDIAPWTTFYLPEDLSKTISEGV